MGEQPLDACQKRVGVHVHAGVVTAAMVITIGKAQLGAAALAYLFQKIQVVGQINVRRLVTPKSGEFE